jgi:cyclopropane fatty-acyl-phospholipid synthase-like methyltransferase
MTPQVEGKTGKDLSTGSHHYRAFIGPVGQYDRVSAAAFNLLVFLGLREHHSVLDIGCGSLRVGKLLIPYLLPERYFGIEPEQWLIDEGIENELGQDLIRIKRPAFRNDRDFALSAFGQQFDFLLAQSIFSHASQSQIKKCLYQAKQVMKPTSVFAATFLEGNENYQGEEWVYPGCVTYTLDHMSTLAREQGLACQPVTWSQPSLQTWMAIVHPEYLENVPLPNDVGRALRLEDKARLYEHRLARLESHPYVRLGLAIRHWMRRILPR